MADVSIIICAYNAQNTIGAAIESALGQTYSEVEVVVVDDASTDGTNDVLQEYALRDQRVRIVRHDSNRQLLEARRTGLENASSPIITYLDADDVLDASAVENALELFGEAEDERVVAHLSVVPHFTYDVPEYVLAYNQKRFKAYDGIMSSRESTHAAFRDFTVTWNVCGKFFSRDVLVAAFGQIPSVYLFELEDALIYFIATCYTDCYIGRSDAVSIHYRCAAGGSEDFKMICQLGRVFPLIEDFLERNDLTEVYSEDLQALKRNQMEAIGGIFLRFTDRNELAANYEEVVKHCNQDEFDAALDRICGDDDWRARCGFASRRKSARQIARWLYRGVRSRASRVLRKRSGR